ncbi:hypothetical protein QYF61_022769, partial [Mycteria americana]
MLAGLDPFVILYMPCDSTQDDLLHQLPRHRVTRQPAMCACSPESQSYPVLHKKKCGQQVKGVDSSPLMHSHETPPASSSGAQNKKDTDLLEWGWNTSSDYEERLRELWLFSLEKRRLWGHLIVAFQYIKEVYKKDGERLFTGACSDRTRSNGFKVKEGRFKLDIKKKFFTRELVDAPSLETFKYLIQTAFKYLQGWRLNHFPGQSVPMLDNPLGEEKFPNIQSKPPLAQLEAISSCPITCYLGEETDPHLSTTSFQVVVESKKVSPQPPFLQAKQSQLPQPLLIRLVLQTLHQLRCPSLDTLQYLNIPLVVGGPKLNTGFEVQPHQCRVQGHDHFPSPAGHAIFDTGQDAIGLLGRLGTLLAHIQAAVNKHPQVLLCQAAFQPLFPKPVALHGVAVAQ